MTNLTKYFRATFAEMKQVKWPTRAQASMYTLLVILVCVVVALFVSFFDFLFSYGVNLLLNR
jgi:preprotein translocase SecE subunit